MVCIKPEYSKRTRGEQFIFVNNRYIKNSSINHAIGIAYKDLISKEHFPSYFIFIEVPTNTIDINIHPTKTEIKFEDERAIYSMIKSCVRNSLGKYNVAHTIDFETETSFNLPPIEQGQEINPPSVKINPDYNPFHLRQKNYVQENLDFLKQNYKDVFSSNSHTFDRKNKKELVDEVKQNNFIQYRLRYALCSQENRLFIIDLFRLHQQIKYNELITNYKSTDVLTQPLLHPIEIDLSSGDIQLCLELKEEFEKLGVEIDQFGKDSIIIQSFPAATASLDAKSFIESCIESFKNEDEYFEHPYEKLAWKIGEGYAHSRLKKLDNNEIAHLLSYIFDSSVQKFNKRGLAIISEIDDEIILSMF